MKHTFFTKKNILILSGLILIFVISLSEYNQNSIIALFTKAQTNDCALEATYNVKDEFGNIISKNEVLSPDVWQIYNDKQGPNESFGFQGESLTRTIRLDVNDGSLRFRCNDADTKCNPEAPYAKGETASLFLDIDPKFQIIDKKIVSCEYTNGFPSYYCPKIGSVSTGAQNEIPGVPILCNMKYQLDWIVKTACRSITTINIKDENGATLQRNDLGKLVSWGISSDKEDQANPARTFDKTTDYGEARFQLTNDNLSFKPFDPNAQYFEGDLGQIKLFHHPDFTVVDRSIISCRSILNPETQLCLSSIGPLTGDKNTIPNIPMKCNAEYVFDFKVKQNPPTESCSNLQRVCVQNAPQNWDKRCVGVDQNKTVHWCCGPGEVIIGQSCQTPCGAGEYKDENGKCVSITTHSCPKVRDGSVNHTLLFVAQKGTTTKQLDELIEKSLLRLSEVKDEEGNRFGAELDKLKVVKLDAEGIDFGCYKQTITEIGSKSVAIHCNNTTLIKALKNHCGGNTVIINTPYKNVRSTASSDIGIVSLSSGAYLDVAHELGHAIASLSDEYIRATDSGEQSADYAPNCSSDAKCQKWKCTNPKKCCIEGCNYLNWFRPLAESIMKDHTISHVFNKPSVDEFIQAFKKTAALQKSNKQFQSSKKSIGINIGRVGETYEFINAKDLQIPPSLQETVADRSEPLTITIQNVSGRVIYQTQSPTRYDVADMSQDSEATQIENINIFIPALSESNLLTIKYKNQAILQKRLFEILPQKTFLQTLIL